MHSIQHRPAFVEANPELKEAHRAAQCELFAAIDRSGLSRDKDLQLEGINAALNRIGSRRLISRKQLKIEEMNALIPAIDAGLFSQDWTWGHDFMIYVRTATVQIPAMTVRMSSVHFEPLKSQSARQWSQPIRPTMTSPLR